MMQSTAIEIVTTAPRHAVIEVLKDCVARGQGWIANHTLLSNKAAMIQAMIEARHLAAFTAALAGSGLPLPAGATDRLMALHDPGSECEVAVFLSASFSHDDPDLRIPVPAVPG